MQTRLAIDGHVHLYPKMDAAAFLDAAAANLSAAGRTQAERACLMFAETASEDAFGRLRAAAELLPCWRAQGFENDPAALELSRVDGTKVLCIRGRQVVTAESIEVLALATDVVVAEGNSLDYTLSELQVASIPAVLPWGVGKWIGARGRAVAAALGRRAGTGLLLGDNAGRPRGWPTPPLFRKAARAGMPILPGTDPLPVPGGETGVGAFGFLLSGAVDPDRPAASLRDRLFMLSEQPRSIGHRRSLAAVLAEQWAMHQAKGSGRDDAWGATCDRE